MTSTHGLLVRALGGICVAVLLLCPSAREARAGGLAPPTRSVRHISATETTTIGHLAWEVTETSGGRMLGQGRRDIYARDVLVIPRGNGDLEQRIPLSNGFYLKLDSGRSEQPFGGFGMAAGRDDQRTFCWEWFVVDHPGRARKLQESGTLGFRQEKIGDFWEIAFTRFDSEVSMRVFDSNALRLRITPDSPTWRVRILEDSHIVWPTLVGRRVLLPSDAKNCEVTPQPGFWSHLVRAAEEDTTESATGAGR